MTKPAKKGATAAPNDAAANWDDAPAPGSQNPEPKTEPETLKASQLMDAIDDLYGAA